MYQSIVSSCPLCGSVFTPLGDCPRCGHTRSFRPHDPLTRTDGGDPPTGPLAESPEGVVGPPPAAPPGYRLNELIGYGGMGLVYRATERDTGRDVAVKYMFARTHPTAGRRFRVEVQSAARLNHPNVVAVYTVNLDSPDPHFVMEYVPGGSLARRLVGGPLPPAEAARVVGQAARGVGAAHAAGILHRDLKPGNLLFAADGTVKVADFGLARRVDGDEQLTGTRSLIGTPQYMAPEQADRDHEQTGPAADVYGLGATLYEALVGRPPFRGATPLATLVEVRATPPQPPRRVRPEVPADLEAICLKCLEKRPADRYPSAAALADDLDRFRAGEPTVARPASSARKAAYQVRRHRWPLLVGSLLVATALGTALAVVPPGPDRTAARLTARLRDGETLTLVGPEGPPAWHAAPFDPIGLGVSPAADRACLLAPTGYGGLLELLTDPGRDSYRLTADLRLQIFLDPAPGQPVPMKIRFAGLYVGRVGGRSPNEGRADGAVIICYQDVWPVGVVMGGEQLFDPRFQRLVLAAAPDLPPYSPHLYPLGGIRQLVREPIINQLPGRWRRLRLDVSPAGVWAYFGADPTDAALVPFAHASADRLDAAYAEMPPLAERMAPGTGTVLTGLGWSSRRPLGVWSMGGAVAVRNVVIEPLP